MLWLYILAAVAVLLLAGFLLIRHINEKDRLLSIELQAAMDKAYIEGMIERGEIPAETKYNDKLMREIIDAKWRKEGKHT